MGSPGKQQVAFLFQERILFVSLVNDKSTAEQCTKYYNSEENKFMDM